MNIERKDLMEAKKMCDMNYEYYIQNFDSLCTKYLDKYIVIKEQSVIGEYDSFEEAYDNTIKTEELGTFLIQHCSEESNNVNYFYSNNVVFA